MKRTTREEVQKKTTAYISKCRILFCTSESHEKNMWPVQTESCDLYTTRDGTDPTLQSHEKNTTTLYKNALECTQPHGLVYHHIVLGQLEEELSPKS